MTPSISELLKRVSELKTKAERIEELRRYSGNLVLLNILRLAYRPELVFDLPPGKPKYKPSEFYDQQGMLYSENRRMRIFLKGNYPDMTPEKRQALFITLLESLDPADAELLVGVKDKIIPYKNITASLVKEAFPGLIDDEQDQKETEQA